MKSNFFKILLILSTLFFIFVGITFATEENSVSPEQVLSQTSNITSVTSLSNLPEANLGLNNILNVILISIGVLLILFAIAILIRLKK